MKNLRTHYDNLKVARNAPVEVIRAAYKTLSQKHHPDRNNNSAESLRIMKIINESYAVLSDPKQRREHDLWITSQEGAPPVARGKSEEAISIQYPPLTAGEAYFKDLDADEKQLLLERVAGGNKDQYAIKLGGVSWSYLWVIVIPGWFYYLMAGSQTYRWSEDALYWHAGLTAAAGLLLARSLSRIYSWHFKPLKSWLIVTPLYVMKLCEDKVRFWPIWTISDIDATHNYRNGTYQNTALTISFDDKPQSFSISPEEAYQALVSKLQDYDQKLRSAIIGNDADYVPTNDDFHQYRQTGLDKSKPNNIRSVITYLSVTLFSLATLGVSHRINQESPIKPAYSGSDTTYATKPAHSPRYAQPGTVRNGALWPTSSSYMQDYEKLHTSGLSTVTVDNSQNGSDLIVKLVALQQSESYPARVFFIPARGKFTVNNITAGRYAIRYRDLETGRQSRSESFSLKETATDSGTRYSNMTVTLHPVRDGNVPANTVSESEL